VRSIVVLPTYNEVESIRPYVTALRAVTDQLDDDVELLVVDDSSPDGTADLVRELADEFDGIRLLVREEKDGLGAAYRAGFRTVLAEDYDVIVSMDADLSHDPAVIPTMLALIEQGADVVIGSRYVDGGGTRNWPVHRRLLSRWGNAYTRAALGISVRDCTAGFRAYRSDVLAAISPESTRAEGYAFLTELVRRLDHAGYRIEETPIVFTDRTLGTSKMSATIIAESMWRVTRWSVANRLGRR
jgi:dolichol-phosphate mannosyltransferase